MYLNEEFCFDNILIFIEKRWQGTHARWFDGNCYWFAKILTIRFPCLKIYYFPIEGHFVAGTGKVFFDADGEYNPFNKPFYDFEELKTSDKALYARLIRDCVN